MADKLEDLKGLWDSERKKISSSSQNVVTIISAAQKTKNSAVKVHLVNIFILLATLAGIAAFFTYVANFSQPVSHIGVTLMMGVLIVRIVLECYSIYLSVKIDLSESSIKTNDAFLKFYQFRKRIHGPVTVTILVLYTIGFYMLTPEFSLYFSVPVMVLVDLSYIAGALIVGFSIRKGIRKEMTYLNEIRRLQDQIVQP